MAVILAIDPGHGMHTGACVDGTWEDDIVWQVAEKLNGMFRSQTILSRVENDKPSFAERAQVARDAGVEMVLSLHCNTSPEPSHQGAITFVKFNDNPQLAFANDIRRALPKEFKRVRNDHIIAPQRYPKGHIYGWLNRPFTVLEPYDVPCVLLEMCYLSNPQDLAAIRREVVRDQVVLACAVAIGEMVAVHASP